jgi:hypothetical protein
VRMAVVLADVGSDDVVELGGKSVGSLWRMHFEDSLVRRRHGGVEVER